MAGYRDLINPNAEMDSQVPTPEPMTIPLREAGGKVVPAPNTSGLYAIYGRKNTAQASADRYSRMAGMDMGGRLGQLPGVVATFMAGKAQNEADKQDAQKETDISAFMERKKIWDKQESDKALRKDNVARFDSEVAPQMLSAYYDTYSKIIAPDPKNPDLIHKAVQQAGLDAAAVGNGLSTILKLGTPELKAFSPWANGEYRAVWIAKDNSVRQGSMSKDGKIGVMGDDGTISPAGPQDMLFSDREKMRTTDANVTKANRAPGGGANPNGLLKYYDANGNLVAYAKLRQEEAVKLGAVTFGENYNTGAVDDTGKAIWDVRQTPLSKAPKQPAGALSNTQVNGQPPAPAAAKKAAVQYGRPNPVPGSPGSGQPAAAPATPAPAALSKDAQDAQAWILANPHAPASQVAAIKAQYKLP